MHLTTRLLRHLGAASYLVKRLEKSVAGRVAEGNRRPLTVGIFRSVRHRQLDDSMGEGAASGWRLRRSFYRIGDRPRRAGGGAFCCLGLSGSRVAARRHSPHNDRKNDDEKARDDDDLRTEERVFICHLTALFPMRLALWSKELAARLRLSPKGFAATAATGPIA